MRYFFLLFILLFTGCALNDATPPSANKTAEPQPLIRYEQNTALLSAAPYLPESDMEALREKFDKTYFAVWDAKKLRDSKKEAAWGLDAYKTSARFLGENKLQITAPWFEHINELANFDKYGTSLEFAITTQNTNLRVFPTDKPLFIANDKGEVGYPFDYMQNSALGVMQPILISHYSSDLAWAFVESSFASGWIKANELAMVNNQTIEQIKAAPKIVVTKENAPLYFENGSFAHYLKAGAILPLISRRQNDFQVFIITAQGGRNAVIAKNFSAPFPLEWNTANVQLLSAELLGENYGWGGLYTNRDCSALTKDFFGSFGIWLPRNSLSQKNSAFYVDISKLTPEQKEAKLKELGVPYLTLVYMRGHIMLYVGGDERVLILHNIWGLKSKNDGRVIIGKSIISDLFLGENVEEIEQDNLLIHKIQGFSIFAPKSAQIRAKLLTFYQDSIFDLKDNIVYFKDGSTQFFDDYEQKSIEERFEKSDIEDQFAEVYKKGSLKGEPENDAGRIRNEEFFGALYGKTKYDVETNLVKVTWLPNKLDQEFLFNKNHGAAQALQAVSDELDKLPDEYTKYLSNIGGTYNYRKVAGSDKLSPHSWGIAIDLNVAQSNYWRWDKNQKYQNKIPQRIIDIFEKHGFIWGGKWRHYDTMHFEYRPEMF